MKKTNFLDINLMVPWQNNKEIVFNEAMLKLDAFSFHIAVDEIVSSAPDEVDTASRYIISNGENKNSICYSLSKAKDWKFLKPKNNMIAFVKSESAFFIFLGSWTRMLIRGNQKVVEEDSQILDSSSQDKVQGALTDIEELKVCIEKIKQDLEIVSKAKSKVVLKTDVANADAMNEESDNIESYNQDLHLFQSVGSKNPIKKLSDKKSIYCLHVEGNIAIDFENSKSIVTILIKAEKGYKIEWRGGTFFWEPGLIYDRAQDKSISVLQFFKTSEGFITCAQHLRMGKKNGFWDSNLSI